ncbi:hypothetical protein [Virgibacillus dokdonensis]|uniref:Uncharacterized protein n=1 Tax=Virgibacillus dokdonensis TaxID=302167 RepID=A0A2K9J4D1_9BACI|nr:hypothetical protein [Virgibacillus dokdonensis]AUJ26535.1 hypothetical protein A21D_03501 [Virgibacillus dokdonensis]
MSKVDGAIKTISPKLHRYLYDYSIKRFLEENFNIEESIKEHNIDRSNKMIYNRLLDSIIYNNQIEEYKINDFLIKELNYGRARNVYVSFLSNISHLKDESLIYKAVQNLDKKGVKNAVNVNKHPFVSNLWEGIPYGERRLIFFNIEKDSNENIKNIKLLLGECIRNSDGIESNNYIGVEINTEYKMLVIKLRNWDNEIETDYGIDISHDKIKGKIKDAFNLSIPLLTSTMQKTVYNMINELSDKVLSKSVNIVNEKIEKRVEEEIKKWTACILEKETELPKEEFKVLKSAILNNFYKMYMQNEVEELDYKSLKEIYKVDGYPRYVKFVDDTVSEGRARSSDPKESLLDTSIYYDIKARLDQAKQLKLTTIYWLGFPGYDRVGITFYTDSQERFKFIVKPNFFNKEMCDYVLRQIEKYRPKR